MQSILTDITVLNEPKWGPTGREVYERTYSRTKANGEKESWYETVERVVSGNLALVDQRHHEAGEREKLIREIFNFRILPAGRHLWMSGVEGRQFLFNCYVSGWTDSLSEHFTFTFNQLMEGGGVGSNYSTKYVNPERYPIFNLVNLQIVCSPEHENYEDLRREGLLSEHFSSEYLGAYEVEDSREGWTNALGHLIDLASTREESPNPQFIDTETLEYRPVLVVDLSNIRPAGKRIKAFGGTSAGPVPLARMLHKIRDILSDAWLDGFDGFSAMHMDHAIAECVVSGNVRRSARMSIMHWSDPNIEWFLNCKKDGKSFWSTNISVEIDDEFIRLVSIKDEPYTIFRTAREEKAKRVYKAIIEGMLRNGEPGIWNSSLANTGEPNPVVATNPCGEICLEPFENCNLGHVNLSAFVNPDGSVDFQGLHEAHRLMTRFLIRATYGDISNEKTREVVSRNRRIGVGHFGFAGFLAKRGIKFSESHWPRYEVSIELNNMRARVEWAAMEYAHQLRIPVPVKCTTVAPTGTIAKMPGETEGIHPPYAKYFIRRIRYANVDPDQAAKIEEFKKMGYNVVDDIYTPNTSVVEIPTKESLVQELEDLGIDPYILEDASQIPLKDMLGVQKMYQKYYANNAVSFTVNVVPGRYSNEEVEEIILQFLPHLKGTTLMVDESRELAPYQRLTKEEYEQVSPAVTVVDDSYDEKCASGACPVR